MTLRYYTAGDSHGPGLLGILEGLPAGLPLAEEDLDRDHVRRQRGFGRSERQLNTDRAEIWGGLHRGLTTGAPRGIRVRNPGNTEALERLPPIRIPRPGHADLAGAMKYGLDDVRRFNALAGADIPGLENVAHLERLPPRGAFLVALPMKIAEGTGGPCRIVAFLP